MQQFESFAQMQRDAERRVMEMQRRATAVVGTPPESPETAAPADGFSPAAPPPDSPAPSDNPLPALGLDDEDAERLLLIAVLLLVREHADRRLLFLLLYLLN